ncbi:hypothetical protein SAMN05444008_1147 [Cnuella takakiae]|uniref:WD40-like Beta Propeller Repeat n=1 Tax=Cnuella takakiae TaxID=1302690 RepID=A0A1M5FHE5_9BACT|nr:hypothetical protein [Cnuella takakiae]OLY93767.1 hypothetical protein BUE76_19165 [Cnuella takakiae]SHF90849.1 hypothetical protein SAMN05444008_1147 [Cnuella takakiae]
MNNLLGRLLVSGAALLSFSLHSQAQVNAVEFGKNRVQYQKFNWKYYQTDNFNTYFSQDGLELGKFVAQLAEKELSGIEEFVEYGLQRRANIAVYNNFDEMQQSNIGLGIDWQNAGGVTRLVNNKMVVYFDGNHNNLRRQVRQGIAQVLVRNVLFGDDLGEMAANQTLLDLPQWLTDGYIAYAAERWSTDLDDQLKSAMLSGDYTNFYQFAHEKPLLAGHAFWYYFGNKYGESKTTYLLYLSRIYRNLNAASQRIAKVKFKEVLRQFMTEVPAQYYKDIRGRRVVPKGQLSVSKEIGKTDYFRFNANPQPRSFTYGVTEFIRGRYNIVVNENFTNRKVLVHTGVRNLQEQMNPNYPILAWDPKGTRLAVLYPAKGKLNFFIYDAINRVKINKVTMDQFDQVQDMKFMLNSNTLLLSAVKSGQTDIFVYNIEKMTTEQITNDVYDDLDASFVAFPNKTGIIFSSNRPNARAKDSDTALPTGKFNIFLVDNWNKSDFKQISQLTNVRLGNARFPAQYNSYHFTFVSDETGINNRYAGFFSTERAGLDTLIFIGDEVLRNPPLAEVDSTLKVWEKDDIDSVGYVSVTNDSSYVFPITNYQSGLLETRTAGDNQQISEVTRQGNYKFLYRLRIDENVLRRRNVTARPTEFMKKVSEQLKLDQSRALPALPTGNGRDTGRQEDVFQTEFGSGSDSATGRVFPADEAGGGPEPLLKKARLFEYRPPKFFNDYVVAALNNTVFVFNKYQPYAGATGPIQMANGNPLNGLIRMGTADLFEDIKISGGFRIAPNLRDNDILFEFNNLRRRIDWGFTYYRSNTEVGLRIPDPTIDAFYPGKQFSSYYLARAKYAFDKVRSLRLTAGPRYDRFVYSGVDPASLKVKDSTLTFGQLSLEYVHDNTINPTMNIWHGMRYKAYIDAFSKLSNRSKEDGPFMFNAGIDFRHYLPIYRNIIWAVRGAADFSWGTTKVAYFLGGVDGWLMFGGNQKTDDDGNTTYRYFDPNNRPDPRANYAYQTLALNLRGFKQNIANGNNAVTINSEIRVPVFSSLLNRPINNAFLRNFQLVQFVDLGSAWNGTYNGIARPSQTFSDPVSPNVVVKLKAGGIGPLAGGYGFGARSTLLGYFVRFDVAWQMDGVFRGKPQTYLALGLDF